MNGFFCLLKLQPVNILQQKVFIYVSRWAKGTNNVTVVSMGMSGYERNGNG